VLVAGLALAVIAAASSDSPARFEDVGARLAGSATAGRTPLTAASEPPHAASPLPFATPEVTNEDVARLIGRALTLPLGGLDAADLTDTSTEARGGRAHEALDIAAPLGTPVVAVDDGSVAKLFTSIPGGLTVYHFDPSRAYAYYYAHLDRYAEGLAAGQRLRRGDVIGYVGTSGNAGDTPHLHFAIFKLAPEARWWQGTPINPYPILVRPAATPSSAR
jgi:murein DD-endopeptidase MepM/ murein hydrolase activator NlpD